MDQYSLLRDNKKSGPFSKEEIISRGFKAYDLIWVEGKSAGWRYPSELPEFKAHAPAVEEQPFDRFYKKPQHQLHAHELADLERNKRAEPVAAPSPAPVPVTIIPSKDAKIVKVRPKTIFVTLPNTSPRNIPVAEQPVAIPEERPAKTDRTSPPDVLTEPAVTAAIPDRYSPVDTTPEAKNDYAAYSPDKNAMPSEDLSHRKYFNNFSNEPVRETVAPRPMQRNQMTLLFRGAIAACLILGGVVIGLLISYSRQSPDHRQLDRLVQQMQQKENTKNTPATTTPTHVATDSISDVTQQNVLPPTENKAAQHIAQVSQKNTTPTNPNRFTSGISNSPVEAQPAVIKKDIPESPSFQRSEISTETTRKQLFELVSLEGSQYKIGVLGGISNLHLTVSNNSLYPLDEIQVQVNYFGPEKKLVRQTTVVVNDVAPGGQKMVDVPRSNRGVSVSYTITRINSKALGIAQAGFQQP